MKKRLSAFGCLILITLVLAAPGLLWRHAQEREMRSSLILFDLLELHAVRGDDPEKCFERLMSAGVSAFLAPEFTAEELQKGVVENVAVCLVSALPQEVASRFSSLRGTAVVLKDAEIAPLQIEYLRRRFANGEDYSVGGATYFRIPASYAQLEKSGVLPDLASMRYLSDAGVPLVYAPSLGYGSTQEEVIAGLTFMCAQFPSIKALCPSGEVASSYSHTAYLSQFVKEHGLLMAQTEFSRQIGAARQVASSWPNIVSLHGVDRKEVLKRTIARPIMLNRLYRAAEEREVRLLVLRLDPLRALAANLDSYCADVQSLRSRLDNHGFARLWPTAAPAVHRVWPILSALGLNILLLALALRCFERFCERTFFTDIRSTLVILAVALILTGLSFFAGNITRLSGAFAAALLAAEASLMAMDNWEVPIRGAVQSFILVLCGGLVVASCFSQPLYMYRIATFSGVKLSLLLPPVLILLIDLRRREHPESLSELLTRPPLCGELALAGGILLAALVMLLRSGNYGFVSTSEIVFRDWLEKILGARPRTKEFLIGYPALVCWYYLKKKDLWAHWREILRLAVSMAYTSAVNSFCHFHTPLTMTLLRGFNGWWIGLLSGVVILALAVGVAKPLYRRLRGTIL